MLPLGTAAPNFRLEDVATKRPVALSDFARQERRFS